MEEEAQMKWIVEIINTSGKSIEMVSESDFDGDGYKFIKTPPPLLIAAGEHIGLTGNVATCAVRFRMVDEESMAQ
jgi:hypothetical protein